MADVPPIALSDAQVRAAELMVEVHRELIELNWVVGMIAERQSAARKSAAGSPAAIAEEIAVDAELLSEAVSYVLLLQRILIDELLHLSTDQQETRTA